MNITSCPCSCNGEADKSPQLKAILNLAVWPQNNVLRLVYQEFLEQRL